MLTSLAELVQQLPSKQKGIGSSPIGCLKIINFFYYFIELFFFN
jgi:hypothetical protein